MVVLAKGLALNKKEYKMSNLNIVKIAVVNLVITNSLIADTNIRFNTVTVIDLVTRVKAVIAFNGETYTVRISGEDLKVTAKFSDLGEVIVLLNKFFY